MSKVLWGFFLILTFIVTLPASWWLLAKADFAYGFLHDSIGISQHIVKYAPKNTQNKKDFELTTKAQRVELFHRIVEAIQNQGEGLEKLSYLDKQKQNIGLLTAAEVIHLKDVAHLLDKLKPVIWGAIIGWLIILAIVVVRRVNIPSAKQLLMSSFVIILLIGGVLALGPEKVFNQLHVWVFPNNHQWFFYYEESLMSTMMKAPDLFAYIAAMWTLLSIVLTAFLLKLIRKYTPPTFY